MQNGPLPGDGTENGEQGRQQLDRAGRAMEDAERALRDGNLITGQQNFSGEATARLVIEALGR